LKPSLDQVEVSRALAANSSNHLAVMDTRIMTPPSQPKIQLTTTPDYRENYANSVQVRVNIWDFFLLFGTINQSSPDMLNIQSFQGVYLSPQQAKALYNVLQQNIKQYESAFGEIRLEAQGSGEMLQ
jgi:flagellar protein FlaG